MYYYWICWLDDGNGECNELTKNILAIAHYDKHIKL